MAVRPVHCALIAAIAASLALGACGRRGALEPPPGQELPVNDKGKKIDPGPVKPNTPFVLDPLLN
ncbi:MAG: LPS translocon maturation chaperone LptM [bacterium]|jgi:predicted small lipoprotein YifL